MGADKALVRFRGRPLIAHALGILGDAGLAASIAGARSDLSAFGPIVNDLGSSQGPLSGICAGLEVTSVPWAAFIPVDLPLLPAQLIAWLLDHACTTGRSVTLASVSGFTETFPAVLNRSALPVLKAQLASGDGGCFRAFAAAAASLGEPLTVVATELLVQSGQVRHPHGLPAARWFLNVNAGADLQRAGAFRL